MSHNQSFHPVRVKHVPTFLVTQSGVVIDGVPITTDFVTPDRVQLTLVTVLYLLILRVPPPYIAVSWVTIPPLPFDVLCVCILTYNIFVVPHRCDRTDMCM